MWILIYVFFVLFMVASLEWGDRIMYYLIWGIFIWDKCLFEWDLGIIGVNGVFLDKWEGVVFFSLGSVNLSVGF